MFKVKILVVGPCQSGKSVISNFLSDSTDTSTGNYRPTQGVRILEFEANNLDVQGRHVNAEVELWDCSGDRKFETCWPVLARGTQGVVFVFNPSEPGHDKELELLFKHFVNDQKLSPSSCLVFAHQRPGVDRGDGNILSPTFSKVPVVNTNIEDDPNSVRTEFNNYLCTLVSALTDRREEEERDIMNFR